ncbi:MAG: hypothetical protein HRU17_08155 [Polyangiaceae bacterium]|nr:hypothetical protein [Polyangiaceae bacterium]
MDRPDKARTLRLQRLEKMLETKLEPPAAALEIILSEMKIGQADSALWERLHAAAARDGSDVEARLGAAYRQVIQQRRLRDLELDDQVMVLIRAADYLLGMLGDTDGAAVALTRVLEVRPTHEEAFLRIETRLKAGGDSLTIAEFYAKVVSAQKPPLPALVRKALNCVARLPGSKPLSAAACEGLLTLLPTELIVVTMLDAHCKKTQRVALACSLQETALESYELPDSAVLTVQKNLIETYQALSDTPEKAIDHVETLLLADPANKTWRKAAEKLLSNRGVASRAAAALSQARRDSRRPPSM